LGQFLCPSSGVFHCAHSSGLCHIGTSWSCLPAVSKPVWHIPLLCLQWKTPDDGKRNCPKHVEFYSKNKLGKFVYLVGFSIIIYHDARLPERQIHPLNTWWKYNPCSTSLCTFLQSLVSSSLLLGPNIFLKILLLCIFNLCLSLRETQYLHDYTSSGNFNLYVLCNRKEDKK